MPFLLVFLVPLVIMFVVISVMLLTPVAGTFVAVKVRQWIKTRPIPTAVLLERARRNPQPFPPADWFVADFERWFFKRDKVPVKPLYDKIITTISILYAAEALDRTFPQPPSGPEQITNAQYRDALINHADLADQAPQILQLLHHTFATAFSELLRKLPPCCFTTKDALSDSAKPFLTVPLTDMLRNAGQVVSDLSKPFNTTEISEFKLFAELRLQLIRNIHDASRQKPGAPQEKLVFPYQSQGSPPEIVRSYLQFTPLQYLFDVHVPFPITPQRRVEHWHLLGGSGHGKTQTLQHIMMRDLQAPDPPALVVIDSQGEMLWKLQHLQLFADNPDRLIIVDPEHSPSLNVFDVTSDRAASYSTIVREQVQAGIIELYHYVFGALASELTAKQGTAFAFVVRLMLATPEATLHTLLELMEDPGKDVKGSRFAAQIEKLDHTARSFFENQFFNKQAFGSTRQQIARRLYAVLSVPAFDRMFSASENKLDMFAAIQAQKVVLVNTSKALLKTDASALFGRFMIAQVMAAAFERIAVPVQDRKAAYLIIDEAADYFDDSLESLLSQARKFNLGVLFAHQHMEQLNPVLRSSVAANTTIKMAGGVSDRDARMLDADMHTSNEFIGSMRKKARSTQFAAYIRNETPTAIRLEIPFGTLESAARMTADDHRALVARNTARLSSGTTTQKPPAKANIEPDEPPPGEKVW